MIPFVVACDDEHVLGAICIASFSHAAKAITAAIERCLVFRVIKHAIATQTSDVRFH